MKGLPKGYKRYDGKGCPVDGDVRVDVIVRTNEGLGHSGVCRAKLHDWERPDGEVGNVVGYRLVQGNEQIDVYARWPE